jgi:hypothetical protein
MINIELRHPASINGMPTKPQSLWLLLALWQLELARVSPLASAPALLTVAYLQAQFPNIKHLRMLITRAFVDFRAWQLDIGWGMDFSIHPDMRSTRNRSQGPFWLMPGVFEAMRVHLNGTAASVAQVRDYLQIKSNVAAAQPLTAAPAIAATSKSAQASAEFWRAFAIAKREQQDGHLIVDGQQGALAGYRLTQRLALHPRQTAFALLQQAMVWRGARGAEATADADQAFRRWTMDQRHGHDCASLVRLCAS